MTVRQFVRERPAMLVLVAAGIHALVLSAVSVAQYVTFATGWDHAIFTQYVWLLGRGESPVNTVNGRFLLGDHVEPGLVLLAPLGALGVVPLGLLVLQSIALASVAPILYLLGRRVGVDPWLSAVVPLLWLVSPAVVRPILWEFHPETLAAPFVALSALAAASGRWRWFVALAVVACMFREDVALLYVGAGVLLVHYGHRRGGIALSAAAALWYAVAVLVVLPLFGPVLTEDYGPRFAGARGDSLSDVLLFAIENPLQFVDETFEMSNFGILAVLVLTTAGLCCLAPWWLIVPAPLLLLNFMSEFENQHTLKNQYFVLPTVAIAVAGVMGAKVFTRLTFRRRSLLRFAAVVGVLLATLSLAAIRFTAHVVSSERDRRADREAIVAAVPPGAAVAASSHLLPHLAQRRELYALPEPFLAVLVGSRWDAGDRRSRAADVEYVALDGYAPSQWEIDDAELDALVRAEGFKPVLRRGAVTLYARSRAAEPTTGS
jgi:uncharacterized membrane protein